jgi:hypothetical protein
MKSFACLGVVAGLFALPLGLAARNTEAASTIYHVSASGSDSTGTPNDPRRPYRSPRGAYADIPADITRGDGDHIIEITDNATYGQLVMAPRVTNAAHRIVLRAAEGKTPTMDAHSRDDGSAGSNGGGHVLLIRGAHVVVQGLHFTNTNAGVDSSLGSGARSNVMVRLEATDAVIERNYFDGNGRTPTDTDIFLLVCNGARDNLIAENRFDYSGGKSLIHLTKSCGGESPGRQFIRNNALSRFGNKPQGICAAINFGGQRGTLAGNGSVVENNTIHDNGGGCFGVLNTNESLITVRNNIFSNITGHRYAVGCNSTTTQWRAVAENSVMFGNTSDVEEPCWTLRGVHRENPYFVNASATPPDLHVESTAGSRRSGTFAWTIDTHCSVAIDNAVVTSTFEREPAPNGGRRNIGAYGNTPEASKSCVRGSGRADSAVRPVGPH